MTTGPGAETRLLADLPAEEPLPADRELADPQEQFPLGREFGALPPRTGTVTDSVTTPLGLRFRVRPREVAHVDATMIGYDEETQTGIWPQPSCGDTQCPTVQPTTKRRDRDNPEIEHDRIRDVGTD